MLTLCRLDWKYRSDCGLRCLFLESSELSPPSSLSHHYCRRLFQPQQNLLTVPEAQVSPLRDTPNSSPAHRPKPSVPEEYTDPLASKKPRISHFSNKTATEQPRAKPSKQRSHKDAKETTGNGGQKISLDPQRLFDSLSAVCQRDAEVAKRLEPTPVAPEEPEAAADRPPSNCVQANRPPSPQTVPSLSRHTIKRKKSKHKHKDQVRSQKKIFTRLFFSFIS